LVQRLHKVTAMMTTDRPGPSETSSAAVARRAPRLEADLPPTTRAALVGLLDRIRRPEDEGRRAGAGLAEVGARMLALIDAVTTALAEVERSDSAQPSTPMPKRAMLFAVGTGASDPASPLADVAVVYTWLLQGKRERIVTALGSGAPDRIDDACASARRALLRALGALDRALVDVGAEPLGAARLLAEETGRSLRTRALYDAFRAAVGVETTPDAATVDARLRGVAVALAQLLGHPAASDLRGGDHRLFVELDARLEAWRHAGLDSDAGAPLAGLRLWQDVATVAGCLRQVSLRAELQDHDKNHGG
jgi:hypothetical protein